MNLRDFNKNSSSDKLNSLLESYNGNRIDFSKMTIKKASRLSRLLESKLAAKRNTVSGKGKKDKAMFEAYMMKSAIDRWVFEQHRKLLEDEMKQAEVILAAKDIVDRLQSMTEDLSKIVNEELPPLGDSIRDTISADKSSQFVSSVTDLLNQVLEAVKQARAGVDSSTRALTGDAADMDTGMGDEGGVPPAPEGGEEGFAGLGQAPDMAMPSAGGEGDPFGADNKVTSVGRARR